MREYASVSPMFWLKGPGKKLRGNHLARELALYLMTGPESTMLGLYYIALTTMAHHLGVSIPEVEDALDDVVAVGICVYDEDEELVFLPEGARWQTGKSSLKKLDNVHRGITKRLAKFDDHPFHDLFVRRYGTNYQLLAADQGRQLVGRFSGKSKAASKPLQSPNSSPFEGGQPGALKQLTRTKQDQIKSGDGDARPPAGTHTPVATHMPKRRPDATTHHPTSSPIDPALLTPPPHLRESTRAEPTKRRSKARAQPDPIAAPSKSSNGATGPSQAKQGGNGCHPALASLLGGVKAGIVDPQHGRFAHKLMAVPEFARLFSDGQTLADFCQAMMRGYSDMGTGKAMPMYVVELAINDTARVLDPDHTDKQSLRKVMTAQLSYKSRDWKAGKLDKPKGPDPNRFRPPPQ